MLFSKKATGFCVFPWRQTAAEPVAPSARSGGGCRLFAPAPPVWRKSCVSGRFPAAAAMQIFRQAFLQKGRQPAPQRTVSHPSPRAAAHRTDPTAPWRPPRNHYSSAGQPLPRPAPAPWWRGTRLCCRPTLRSPHPAPSCGTRRPARSGGGCRIFSLAQPVWHESCASGRFPTAAAMQIFRQAFLQKGRCSAPQRTVCIRIPGAAARRIASVPPRGSAPYRSPLAAALLSAPLAPSRGTRRPFCA